MIVFHRTGCFWASASSWQHVCLCRPYEPGLHLDGSELTGLLQEDRQEGTTTDGQSFPTGTQALLTCFSCAVATGKASVTSVLLPLLPRSSIMLHYICVFAVLCFHCSSTDAASRCICNLLHPAAGGINKPAGCRHGLRRQACDFL